MVVAKRVSVPVSVWRRPVVPGVNSYKPPGSFQEGSGSIRKGLGHEWVRRSHIREQVGWRMEVWIDYSRSLLEP